MSAIDDAVGRVMGLASSEASPDRMSQEEAVEFYDAIASQAEELAGTIRAEMRAS